LSITGIWDGRAWCDKLFFVAVCGWDPDQTSHWHIFYVIILSGFVLKPIVMTRKFLIPAFLFFTTMIMACNNGDDAGAEKNPSVVQPPSEAIPDSTKLVNDSAIMIDTTPGNGSQVGNADSIQKNKH
jgi:hypothetical protein